MFVLYAIPIGILAGYLLGGRLDRLAELRLRWVPLILLGLAVQAVIFTDAGGRLVGGAGPALYIASTAAVFVAVLRNIRVPGVALIAIGAGCNLAAIVANAGYMPADPAAIASIGGLPPGYTNSDVVEHAALLPLTDLFALPVVAAVRQRVQRRGRADRGRCRGDDRACDATCVRRPGRRRSRPTPSGLTCCRPQTDLPTVLRILLTWPPRKMRATIATMAIRARISAYSARPWPSSSRSNSESARR